MAHLSRSCLGDPQNGLVSLQNHQKGVPLKKEPSPYGETWLPRTRKCARLPQCFVSQQSCFTLTPCLPMISLRSQASSSCSCFVRTCSCNSATTFLGRTAVCPAQVAGVCWLKGRVQENPTNGCVFSLGDAPKQWGFLLVFL